MMRQSETMRAASRLLLSHPIVCLFAALAAVVLLGVLGPIKVVHAADVALRIQGESFATQPPGTKMVSGAGYDVGAALKFNQNVTASTTVNCTAVCDVTLWAKGGQSGGQASLSVNGSPAPPAQVLTSKTVQPYTFNANLPAGGAELRVTASGTGIGHNAILDYVTFPESSGTPPAQCNDTLDNDSDSLIDYPNDPGCLSATDNDETNATGTTARLVGAGDIGSNGDADIATGDLIDARPNARVFTAGDNAYHDGTPTEFQERYHEAWGSFKNRTSPTPGNHDWNTRNAQGYRDYFGNVAGLRTVDPITWYVYNLGAWRIYALDSESSMAVGSAQYNFVQQDLDRNRRACMAAIWHHPIASSGQHGNESNAHDMFALMDLAVNDVDLVLNGHDHNYERFAKIDADGNPDTAGIQEIVVGTGGTRLRGLGFLKPGSQRRNFNTHGIVDINLTSTGYSGKFVPVAGKTFSDSFSGTCGA